MTNDSPTSEQAELMSTIEAGIVDEEDQEALVDGDGHAETSGSGSEEGAGDEVDELVDGSAGGSEADGQGEDELSADESYFEGAEAGGEITEVEGYLPSAQEFSPPPETMEIVHGSDDRIRVWNTTSYPWRTICDLEITAADGSKWQCSGALIGPRTVLTNGHCVYMHNRGGWVRSIRVIAGRNNLAEPRGSATSTFFHSVKGWTNSKSSNYDYAVAVLPKTMILNGQTLNKPLGIHNGWMGLANLSYFSLWGLRVNNSGYPGDKPPSPKGSTQWWNANNVLAVTSRRLYYRIDTAGGQSGSPVWRYKNGKRHIVAVHNTGGAPFNGSVRIVKPVFKNLVKWKNKYT